jgi:hypothetical protein
MPEAPVFGIARRTFHLLGSASLVVGALYWGQKILIPFALAILLAFVLAPLSRGWSGAASGGSRLCCWSGNRCTEPFFK